MTTFGEITEFNETDWARGWVTTREVSDRHGGSITIPAPPWHFSGNDGTLSTQVPARQGEHNEEILKEIDMTVDEFLTVCNRFTNKRLFKIGNDGKPIRDRHGDLLPLFEPSRVIAEEKV